jgi:N4-gp56 family major capsid protein
MATTSYGVNHQLTVKLWARKLFQEALKECWMSKFMGKGSDSLIQILEETSKGPGDRITVGLRMQLSGTGVQGDGTLEGNEESLTTYSDNLLINQLRHAIKSDGKMSEQRITFDIREEARAGLTDWWADRIDTCLFNQLGGNTGVSDTKFSGNNSTIAPDANHIIYPNGTTTEAQVASASASNIFKLKFIDYAVERAKTLSPLIRPLRINGEDKYVCFIHPYQLTDLRTDASTNGSWYDIQKAALQGGKINDNPIYNGAAGEYNNTIIHVSTRVPTITAGVYRTIFCGAQSAIFAYGQDSKDQKMSWVEKLFDYGNQLGVSSGMIFGAKKTVYNSADFGTIVIPTYAAQH